MTDKDGYPVHILKERGIQLKPRKVATLKIDVKNMTDEEIQEMMSSWKDEAMKEAEEQARIDWENDCKD
jgi:hypothetical protein